MSLEVKLVPGLVNRNHHSLGKNGEHMGRYDLTKMIWDIVLSGSNGLNMYTFLRCMKIMFQSL